MGDIMLLCVSLSMNAVLTLCYIIYMIFSEIWLLLILLSCVMNKVGTGLSLKIIITRCRSAAQSVVSCQYTNQHFQHSQHSKFTVKARNVP